MSWIALHTHIIDDRQLRELPDGAQMVWLYLLCLARSGPGPVGMVQSNPADLAWRLHMAGREEELGQWLAGYIEAGFLVADEEHPGFLVVRNWSTYQHEAVKGETPDAVRRASKKASSDGGTWGNHVRWHVNRSTTSDDCVHCFPEQEQDAAAQQDDAPAAPPAGELTLETAMEELSESLTSEVDAAEDAIAAYDAALAQAPQLTEMYSPLAPRVDVEGVVLATIVKHAAFRFRRSSGCTDQDAHRMVDAGAALGDDGLGWVIRALQVTAGTQPRTTLPQLVQDRAARMRAEALEVAA